MNAYHKAAGVVLAATFPGYDQHRAGFEFDLRMLPYCSTVRQRSQLGFSYQFDGRGSLHRAAMIANNHHRLEGVITEHAANIHTHLMVFML